MPKSTSAFCRGDASCITTGFFFKKVELPDNTIDSGEALFVVRYFWFYHDNSDEQYERVRKYDMRNKGSILSCIYREHNEVKNQLSKLMRIMLSCHSIARLGFRQLMTWLVIYVEVWSKDQQVHTVEKYKVPVL